MRARTAPAYSRRVGFVLPQELKEAIEQSASSQMCSINSWVRQACLLALARESTDRGSAPLREVRAGSLAS
jgi:hypothetical protein